MPIFYLDYNAILPCKFYHDCLCFNYSPWCQNGIQQCDAVDELTILFFKIFALELFRSHCHSKSLFYISYYKNYMKL